MEIPKWIHDILFSKRYRLIKHLAFWLFIYADEFLSLVGLTDPLEYPFWYVCIEMLMDMALVYFNIFFLLPKFFLNGRIVSYAVLSIMSIFLIVTFNYFLYANVVFDYEDFSLIQYYAISIVQTCSILFMAVAMKLILESYLSNIRIRELQEDKLQTELAYLRTQVNPHFLFNTLNNMYVMSKKKDENLSDSIMQLSDLLRYQLYDCDADTVLLRNEIAYLKNYLKLESLRREHLNVDFNIEGEINTILIRPLILLPFIENAFKYSNSGTGSDYIRISIRIDGSILKVEVENNKGSLHQRDVGGIGLANATRRLELGYPDKHKLNLIEDDKTYLVKIDIDTE